MLFKNEKRPAFYILKASAFTIATSLSLLLLASFLIEFPDEGPSLTLSFKDFFGVVFFAPFVETLLMILSVRIFFYFSGSIIISSLLNGLLWAGLHSMLFPLWGLFVFIPFVVFSFAYFDWRNKSKKLALFVPFVIHAILNSTPFVLMAAESMLGGR
jgi:hypothetical protein